MIRSRSDVADGEFPEMPPVEAFADFERRVEADFPSSPGAPPYDVADVPALRMVVASALSVRPPPPRRFLVEGMIPHGTVTLVSGDGGTGKSLLALQLGVAVAGRRTWLGIGVSHGGCVYVSAEDDLDEIHRRLAGIAEAEGLDLRELDGLQIVPLAGEGAVLAAAGRSGTLVPTPLWAVLQAKIGAAAPALVVLDTSADFFGGNEIDRAQVRQFVGMLRGLAMRADCAIVLLSHPSVAGMSSGSGLSGSTAWTNSVRSRLYLTKPTADEGGTIDPDLRVLSMMKLNYGPAGAEIRLKWQDGRFVNESNGDPTSMDTRAIEAKAEAVFLDLLQQFAMQDRDVSANPGRSYAPTQFAAHHQSRGVRKSALQDAMNRLLTAGRIRNEPFGPPSRRRSHLVFVDLGGGQ